MWPRFGIKIGNSTLCTACVKADGKIEVVANKQGDRVTQACLLWSGGNDVECGLTAQQKMLSRPTQAVTNSFQFLVPREDLTNETIESKTKDLSCAYDADQHQFELRIANSNANEVPSRRISPFEVHVQFLKTEFELARQFLDSSSSVGDQKPTVVLSIPSYYTVTTWSPLAKAAEDAGFHVAQIITEPTAAILAYGIEECAMDDVVTPTESIYVLSIKCGGIFSHFALYELTNGIYKMLDSRGPFSVGGKQYTDALVQFICEEFHKKYKLDPHESRRSMAKIWTAATNCKHILTALTSTQIYIDSLMAGVDFNMQMSRARFESLIQPVINSFLQTLSESVNKMLLSHATVSKIDEIVLHGGSMRIPKVQAAVAARFKDAKLNASFAADEVVAIGCARQAIFLVDPAGQTLEATEECLCADADVYIWHETNEENPVILLRKGTLLPNVVTAKIQSDCAARAVSDDDINIFHIKIGDKVSEVCLKDAITTPEGFFKIEATVSIPEEEEESSKLSPVIKLRCL